MKLIFGLGNIGKKYELTRHNIGFMVVDSLSRKLNVEFKENKKMSALIAESTVNSEKVFLVKPTTMMNDSGLSVKKMLDFYKLSSKDIIVFVDDIDRPAGKFRLKKSGSSGGQNGLNSINRELGTEEYIRGRLGVDRPAHNKQAVIEHVLGNFSNEQLADAQIAIEKATSATMDLLSGVAFNQVTNLYNS